MTPTAVKTRFAPSPTGMLHLGNIRTALFSFLAARAVQGRFLLRIEDTDATRGHERFASAIETDLRWLGMEWDEGPGIGGPAAPYVQSERGSVYQDFFAALERTGVTYPCFCTEHELEISRKTQIAAGRPPRYSGRCRSLSAEEVADRRARGLPATLRFRVPERQQVEFNDVVRGPQSFATDDIGDFVIRRSDGTPAFFFCNAVDDALMGVTLVLRGEDHLTNTPRQLLLLTALGLAAPRYGHIALVVGGDGAPLSKRTGSKSVEELRTAGFLPLAIVNYLARLGHTYEDNALLDPARLAADFAVERLHKAPARFDEAQLRYWQKEAVLRATDDELWAWMAASALAREIEDLVPPDARTAFVQAVRDNIVMPEDVLGWSKIFFSDSFVLTGPARDMVEYAPSGYFERVLNLFRERPNDPALFGRDIPIIEGKKRALSFQLLRAALTNRHDGPEFARIHRLMPKDRIERRLADANSLSSKS